MADAGYALSCLSVQKRDPWWQDLWKLKFFNYIVVTHRWIKFLLCSRNYFTNSTASSAAWSERCQLRNSPERCSDCPYTSSGAIPWIFSFQVEWIPRSTVDKVLVQRVPSWHVIAALSWRCKHSTKPFADGWYAVVLRWVVPKTQFKCMNRYDSNCLPWLVVIRNEVSNLTIQWS